MFVPHTVTLETYHVAGMVALWVPTFIIVVIFQTALLTTKALKLPPFNHVVDHHLVYRVYMAYCHYHSIFILVPIWITMSFIIIVRSFHHLFQTQLSFLCSESLQWLITSFTEPILAIHTLNIIVDHWETPNSVTFASLSAQKCGNTALQTVKISNFGHKFAPQGSLVCPIFTKFSDFVRVSRWILSFYFGCFRETNFFPLWGHFPLKFSIAASGETTDRIKKS